MKFYVILIQTFNNGDAEKKSIYDNFSTVDEAIANFHKNFGSAMLNDKVATVLCMAINSAGGIYKNESWTNPVTPTPVVEEPIVEEPIEEPTEEVTE